MQCFTSARHSKIYIYARLYRHACLPAGRRLPSVFFKNQYIFYPLWISDVSDPAKNIQDVRVLKEQMVRLR
jgi:hypothetical protein